VGGTLGPVWAFTHRRRRPPPDPVNALLSFGYTLLTRDAVAACELAGLDPAVGFLHELHRGRPSLALDLIEEFRPVIVDHLVIRLCTSGNVSPAGFTTDESGRTGCRMDRDTCTPSSPRLRTACSPSPTTQTLDAAPPTAPL
jgi:CRISPR-associated protein Cas1